MATCPNKSLEDWKLLVASRGEDMAYYLWDTYDGNVPKEEQKAIVLQKETEEVPVSRSSEETLTKVKALIAKMGVKMQDLQDYLKGNPDVKATDVNGLADLVKGIIAIAEGKEDVALTEEMVHIATAIIEKLDPKFVTAMISKIDRFAIYKKVLKAYEDDKNYQLPNGKPDIRKIKKEAVDKLIAELIIRQSEGSTEFPELLNPTTISMVRNWSQKILDWFGIKYKTANINLFEEAASKILKGDIGARYYNEVKSGVEELFDSNPELATQVYEALGFNSISDVTLDKPRFNPDNPEAISYPIKINDKYAGVISVNNEGYISSSIGMAGVELEKEFQGKGFGTKVYLALANKLAKESKTLKSEAFGKQDINDSANRVWKSLLDKGLAVDKGKYFEVVPTITPQQKQQALQAYSQYLDTIFPNSKVKDIVYHGTHTKFDKFEKGHKNHDGRKTKTEGFHLIAAVDKKYYKEKYKGLIAAILDFKNPVSANDGNYESALEYLSQRDIAEFKSKGFDSGIKFINDEDSSLEYVAFEPEQIHILGNKQDVEGFKTFMETAPAEFQGEGVFFKKGGPKLSEKQKELQELIIDTKDRIKKRESKEKVDPLLADSEEASNYYVELETTGNERRITKRVTDRVKAWYEQRFGKNKKFTKEEEFINDFKRDNGIKYHFYFEDVHNRYFKEDGTRRETPISRTIDLIGPDEEVYERLEQYYVDLVKKFSEGKKNPLVFSEVVVYDPKEEEAGTIDLLIIEENGKANIFDWKFMTVSATAEDVAWYKQGAYNIQLGRYKDILRESYGVKEFGQMRAIPILMDVKRKNWRNPDSELMVKGIEIGSVDVGKIKDFTLVPVSEETESTGNEELDEAITQLNAVLKQIGKEDVTNEDEKRFKGERMNALSKAIRAAQSANNLVPLIQVIKLMRKEGQNLINDWETIYNKKTASTDDINDVQLSEYADSLREYMAISKVFGSMNDLIGNLIYDKSEIKNAKTDKQKEDLAKRKAYLENIDNEAKLIRLSSKKVEDITGKFADKFMGERNLVQGLLSPQAIMSGVGSFFRGASEVSLPSISILFKLVTNAKARARRDALKEVEELMSIRKRITDKGGDVRKYVQQLYQKDDKNKLVNKIIYKYKKEFYDLVDKNASEESPSKEWLYNNLDREGYLKEAKEVLEKRIERIKRIYSEDKEMMAKLILQEKRMFDVTRNDFTGWNNYIIKRHPLKSIDKNGIETSPWLTDEYKNIQNDKELFDLYNFLIKTNKKSADIGYLENKVHSTFLPFVRKSMAESLAWDFSLSSIMNFGNGLSLQADDIGFGNVNELTGEIEHSIPKYYTSDFSMKQDEAGNTIHDYTDVSEDLFKNMILYINHIHNYKYLSEVEGQAQLIKTVESFKKHLATTRSGDVILKPNGKPEELEGNEQNTKMFDDFLRALLYEQKYPMSDTDTSIETGVMKQMKKIVNSVAGKEVFTDLDKPSATSLFKSMDALNRAFQLKTLGLEIISGAVNLFGANIQVITQAGNYFTKWDYFKNFNGLIGSRFKNDDDRKMFLQLIDTFMPLKDDPTYDKLKEAGLSKITQQNFSDWLMVFMREPEQHVEKSIFMTLLDNSMIVDGKIVNIREFVKNKYKDRYNSASDYASDSKKIEDEITELKSTSSITNTMKLENDKLVIPGFDLNNFKEIDRVTKLSRRISRNATGGMSDSDINRVSMSVWGRSMMVFKNWIPKLVDTRFGELRKISDDFSVTIDENGLTEGEKYDIGRVRLWWGVLVSSIQDKSFNVLNIIQVNDKGILLLDKMYSDYAQAYQKRTGQNFTMTKEDFNDMIRTNLKNQVQELTMLLVLFGLKLSMGLLAPDDDDDDIATKNFYRFSQRVVDKFVGELSFFYNPLEAEKILEGSIFPAIGLFSDVVKFMSHFSSQVLGFEVFDPSLSSEEVREKAQPVKYLAKMLPVTKSLMTYGAILNSEFAKEFDITIQKESRR